MASLEVTNLDVILLAPKRLQKIDLQDSWTKKTSQLEVADIAMCGTLPPKARRQMAAAGSKGNLDVFGEAHSASIHHSHGVSRQ